MEVDITERMVRIARAAEAQIKTSLSKKRVQVNYTDLDAEGRWYYGCLGELAFMELLRQNGKRADYTPRFDGRSDGGDVALYLPDMIVSADIKTASKPTHQFLMLPKKQAEIHKYSTYIAVKLFPHKAEIMGYACYDDLKDITQLWLSIPTVGMPFERLRPIEQVLNKLEDGDTNIDLSKLGGQYADTAKQKMPSHW